MFLEMRAEAFVWEMPCLCLTLKHFNHEVMRASVASGESSVVAEEVGVGWSVSCFYSSVRLRWFRNEDQNGDYKTNEKDLI